LSIRHDLMQTPLQRCREAIEAGDKEAALQAVQQVWDEGRPPHDFMVETFAALFTFIRDNLGEDAVRDAWREAGEQVWRPVVAQLKELGDPEAIAQMFAGFLRAHGHVFTVLEDEEKYQFIYHFCGTGGLLIREGMNEDSSRHSLNFGVLSTEADWTFHRRLPVYCVNTPVWFDMLPREWGWDVFEARFGCQFDAEGKPVDDPCSVTLYKKPRS
jgi:hypothetical protein